MFNSGPNSMPPPSPIGPQMPPHLMGSMPPNHMMDPASNNQPLQFNSNKGKPPMPIIIEDGNHGDGMSRSPDDNVQMGNVPPGMGGPMGPMPGQSMGPLQGPSMGPWGPMNGMMGPNMMSMDPNMMMTAYNQYGYMGPMPPMEGPMVKEIITLKSCVLYPPPPNAPPPSTRERPPGCRTVFVGGLPELVTEDIVHEIFDNCGPICSIRLSKKNFAHVRFEMENCVDRCIYLSGYRVKIENKDDKENTGRIHVDYAQARDDLYEWECQQRMFAREERHRMRMEEAKFRPPSPPPVIHYSEHEASLLLEKLKCDDSFLDASNVLITWLERGDCSRRSANSFYSMVQSTNAHIRRLLSEKQQQDEELENIKIQFSIRQENIIKQFIYCLDFSKAVQTLDAEVNLCQKMYKVTIVEQIETVFTATSKQKAWDHFSKAQRKNLDLWRKQTKDIVVTQREAFLKGRQEADMEMSDNEDNEGSAPKKKKIITDPAEYAQQAMLEWQTNHLKEENDSLKCQLEAYKNEVDLVKLETNHTDDTKDKQIKALQQALQGMQLQLIQAKKQMKKDEEEVASLKVQVSNKTTDKTPPEIVVVSTYVEEKKDEEEGETNGEEELSSQGVVDSSAPSLGSHSTLPEKEARILAVLSTFLHVHPFGASLDYIWSYLDRLDIKVRTSELEDLLERYPLLYKQTIYGIGASIEKRWKFIGFDVVSPSSVVLL